MAVKFPSYADAENSPGSQQLLWCCGEIVIQIQLAVKMLWRWKLSCTHIISLPLLLLLLLTVMGFISSNGPSVHKKNWKELGQSDQLKSLVTDLWEGYSQPCGTWCLGRRNRDVDSAPFPGRVEEMGQEWDRQWKQQMSDWGAQGKGHLERRQWPGREGWTLHSKAGRAQSEGPSEVKIIALGRGRGEEGGAQLKHEISGFTNGSKVKKADLERLL